jgi:hypothetical protein
MYQFYIVLFDSSLLLSYTCAASNLKLQEDDLPISIPYRIWSSCHSSSALINRRSLSHDDKNVRSVEVLWPNI